MKTGTRPCGGLTSLSSPSQQPPPPQGLHLWGTEHLQSERFPLVGGGTAKGPLAAPTGAKEGCQPAHTISIPGAIKKQSRGRTSSTPASALLLLPSEVTAKLPYKDRRDI
jgi:hypothetical protein